MVESRGKNTIVSAAANISYHGKFTTMVLAALSPSMVRMKKKRTRLGSILTNTKKLNSDDNVAIAQGS